MSELGDLSNFLKEGSLADLSWLDVDPAEYRKLDTLPKQNLDIAPDLQAVWSHEDKASTTYLIPNSGAPRTMGDMSQMHGKLASDVSAAIAKVARFAVMQSTDAERFRNVLLSRFDMASLQANRHVIAGVLQERGLLGGYYIDASDFSGCHNSSKSVVAFARKYANGARFVKAKSECSSCIHAKSAPTGGSNCAVFHKQIVVDVPYSDDLASKVEQAQAAKGYSVQASQGDAKKRVKLAMLAPQAEAHRPVDAKPIVNPEHLLRPVSAMQEVVTRARDLTASRIAANTVIEACFNQGRITVDEAREAYQMVQAAASEEELTDLSQKVASLEPIGVATYQGAVMTAHSMAGSVDVTAGLTRREVVKTASRYMNEGLYGVELLEALKKRFDKRDLVAAKDDLRKVIAEQGLQGVYYVDASVYADYGKGCNEAERLHRARLVPYAKLGSACGGCVHNRENRCSKLNKPLVVEPPYENKVAQQRAILATGPATTVPYESIVNNGLSMMAEFELQKQAADVEINDAPKTAAFEIDFGTGKVKL